MRTRASISHHLDHNRDPLSSIAGLTRRENAVYHKKNAVAPHREVPYSQHQQAVWEQLQSSNSQPTQDFSGLQFWIHPQQSDISDPYYHQHNQNLQQQEWERQARLFQSYHFPDQPQLQHGWGQQAFVSGPPVIHDQSYPQAMYYQEPTPEWRPDYNASNQLYHPIVRPLTPPSLDVSMLDEPEWDSGEDIIVSCSNPPTPYRRPQALPVGNSVLLQQQNAHLQSLSYLASLGLEYLGLKQLSLNSGAAPPASVSTIAPIARESNLPTNGLGLRQPTLVAQAVHPQQPPNSLTPPPAGFSTNLASSNDSIEGKKYTPDATKPKPQILTSPRHNNTPEPEALTKRPDTTEPSSPYESSDAVAHLSSIPPVVGNPMPDSTMVPPAELDHQPTDNFTLPEPGPGVSTPLNETTEDVPEDDAAFHDQFHELFLGGFNLNGSANYSDPFQWNESQSILISDDVLADNSNGQSESSATHDHSDSCATCEGTNFVFDDFSGLQEALDETLGQKQDDFTSKQAHVRETSSYLGSKHVPPPELLPETPYLMPGKTNGSDTAQYASPSGGPPDLPNGHTWNHVPQIHPSLLTVPEMAACGSSVSGYSSLGPDTPRSDPNVDVHVLLPETHVSQDLCIHPVEATFSAPSAFSSNFVREKQASKHSEPEVQAVTNRLAKTVNEYLHDSFKATDYIIEVCHMIQNLRNC